MDRIVTSEEVRTTFLDFFLARGHHRIEGSSLIPENDPTLLFINSGMAPLKPFFTGQQTPPHPDLCNVQPCLRTRDIDDVGDRHHLTFFEMLGSWSIGNYFKERAIELAHDLLLNGFGLSADRLYVTVFAGDDGLGLPPDEEAAKYWEAVGVPRERIVALGLSDNFWGPAGDTGPCGPCTEVFYDFGPKFGAAYRPGDEFDTTSRYIEIWNAGVFMQFDKRRDGTFAPLPFFSVDTGAGLERLTMALNELPTVYDIDSMAPLVEHCQELLGQGGPVLDHHRLMADHVRAATFVLSEGVKPSNEGRGYIPRRLIRKCVAVARQQGVANFELRDLAKQVIELMGAHYPQLGQREETVLSMLAAEEQDFARAVQRGMDHLDQLFDAGRAISGNDAFHLFATYGLPFEITRDFAAQRGIAVDEAGFQDEFRTHQETSRARDRGTTGRLSPTDPLVDLPLPTSGLFVGYETTSVAAHVLALFRKGVRVPSIGPQEEAEILLDLTPFYAEGGGQVGDQGELTGDDGSRFSVANTTKHGSGYHVHLGVVTDGNLTEGQVVLAKVDERKRLDTAANHSATHLLNAALRQVLGDHVRQAGSLVEPQRLRFDFTNPAPLGLDQLLEVERIVNREILVNHARKTDVLPPDEARGTGAVFLDDEEYGSAIRVVSFGDASVEFCGGTHVGSTSEIGFFRIVGEQAVAAGVRRLNAVTRDAALDLTLEHERVLLSSAGKLRVKPAALPERIDQLVAKAKGGSRPKDAPAPSLDLLVEQTAGVPTAAAVVDDDVDVRTTSIREAKERGAVVSLVGRSKGKTRIAVAVPEGLVDQVDARIVLADLLAVVGGNGGGSARFAQGGGAENNDLSVVTERLPLAVRRAVASERA